MASLLLSKGPLGVLDRLLDRVGDSSDLLRASLGETGEVGEEEAGEDASAALKKPVS